MLAVGTYHFDIIRRDQGHRCARFIKLQRCHHDIPSSCVIAWSHKRQPVSQWARSRHQCTTRNVRDLMLDVMERIDEVDLVLPGSTGGQKQPITVRHPSWHRFARIIVKEVTRHRHQLRGYQIDEIDGGTASILNIYG